MFKTFLISSFLFLSSYSESSYAADRLPAVPKDHKAGIVVLSSQRNLSAMAINDSLFYSKAFDLVVTNGGIKPLNLNAGCFKAVMPDKTLRPVDTIEDVLTSGSINAGDSVKGFVSFSAPNDEIYKASAVKFLPLCK